MRRLYERFPVIPAKYVRVAWYSVLALTVVAVLAAAAFGADETSLGLTTFILSMTGLGAWISLARTEYRVYDDSVGYWAGIRQWQHSFDHLRRICPGTGKSPHTGAKIRGFLLDFGGKVRFAAPSDAEAFIEAIKLHCPWMRTYGAELRGPLPRLVDEGAPAMPKPFLK